MARYQSEEDAAADGIRFEHEPGASRYAVYQDVDGEEHPRLIGEAHYALLGDDTIDFDHTVVVTVFRGTGIAGLLARRAIAGDAARGRLVRASCWFIARYLRRYPELLDAAGRPAA